MKILLCSDRATLAVSLLASQLSDHEIITCPSDTIIKYLDSVDIVIPWMANIDASIIASGNFGLVQEFGVGIETIDIEAATYAGIWVAHVPGNISRNNDSVAEHAIMLMLMLSRHMASTQQSSKAEDWSAKTGIALWGKTACIVGLGDIGTALAVRLRAFGMRLVAVRQHPERGALPETGIEKVYGSNAFSEALSIADYVILCAEYSKNTHHLINRHTITAIKPGAFLINVARGGLVDTDALEAALEEGNLAGAGLDVVESPTDSLSQQNVIITPHIAAATEISYNGIATMVADNIKRYARGEQPRYAVNTPHKLRGPE